MALGHRCSSTGWAGPGLPSGRAEGPAGTRPRRLPRGSTTARARSWLKHGLQDSPSNCCSRLPSRGFEPPSPATAGRSSTTLPAAAGCCLLYTSPSPRD
eukprot:14166109-Alexandrium_andersonii.AAC.1